MVVTNEQFWFDETWYQVILIYSNCETSNFVYVIQAQIQNPFLKLTSSRNQPLCNDSEVCCSKTQSELFDGVEHFLQKRAFLICNNGSELTHQVIKTSMNEAQDHLFVLPESNLAVPVRHS